MKQLGWVVCVVVLVAAVTGTVLYGQGGGGGGGGNHGGGMGTAPGGMDLERMKTQLAAYDLSADETAAAGKNMEAKFKARQALMEELGKLRQLAEDPQATTEQLTAATTAYTKAMAKYRATVQSEDSALAKKLTPRSTARLLAAGILDNGLGGGRFRGGGGGGARGGGGGGQRSGGGGEAPPPPQD